jgi:hypothetical protein
MKMAGACKVHEQLINLQPRRQRSRFMADPAQLRGVALQHLEDRIRIGRYLDLPAICVEGWHARTALSAMRNKTDKAP